VEVTSEFLGGFDAVRLVVRPFDVERRTARSSRYIDRTGVERSFESNMVERVIERP